MLCASGRRVGGAGVVIGATVEVVMSVFIDDALDCFLVLLPFSLNLERIEESMVLEGELDEVLMGMRSDE